MTHRWPDVLLVTLLAVASAPTTWAQSPAPSGWLGVALGEAPPPAEGAPERPARGVQVVSVVEESPAERADLREGDVILSVDGLAVSSPSDLVRRVASLPPGSWIALALDRRGRSRVTDLRIAERPEDVGSLRMRTGWIGVRALEVPPSIRVRFGAPEDRGVMVWDVVEGSPAGAAGLEVGDVVYEVSGEPVRSAGELLRRTSRSGVGNTVEVGVARDGARLTLEVLVEKRPADERGRGED